jgi:hypothetical protein
MCLLQHLSHTQSEERADFSAALLTEALARLASQPLAGAYIFDEFRGLRRKPHSTAPAPDRTAARGAASTSAMAATNKCLAQSNKSRSESESTKKRAE